MGVAAVVAVAGKAAESNAAAVVGSAADIADSG